MRTQVLSYGGGVQTVAMVALVLQGKLPRPDKIVIADTGREKTSTWDYLDEVVQPALQAEGMIVEIAPHSLAKVDLYAHNGDLLLPVYTATGKLPTFCSNEWKQRVIMRYLRQQEVINCDTWIGFTVDERDRYERAKNDSGWYQRTFPLYDLGFTRADCRLIIEGYGWPVYEWSHPRQLPEGVYTGMADHDLSLAPAAGKIREGTQVDRVRQALEDGPLLISQIAKVTGLSTYQIRDAIARRADLFIKGNRHGRSFFWRLVQ